ncbi:pantetheine-phosphate adenylyltransferase [Limosilactobacillus equigenerosi]|uniref:Phosphopantetheine adenylyltransferase n=1 Tax=Limosilactobacillus equigenerosi DSM 18793 = JCM 14505 TaxID=1423742 RepID=A0A0R1UXM0_9LACO|nr:pantetheine-phosphate adenylyltransferase [Limosilactobacillus equigenerosi]KRL95976.1 Phosphopantetheine adenylyltransferase [Limosilactobacillus equigenerosi DSM 18793 = JCM 14505]MCQ2569371.1 pantetheine-phosphate adenylyltransferase [Limosilactobacillus sp.]
MKVALYPGSFDPLTQGHVDLIQRASRLFDQLIVAVMKNTSKQPLFSVEERIAQIDRAIGDLPNVTAIAADGLTVTLMNQVGADYLIRGIRNQTDFLYERDIATMNHHLDPEIETVFLLADPQYQHLSSSLLKEVAAAGGDIQDYLPQNVQSDLQKVIHQRMIQRLQRKNGEQHDES